MGTKLVVADVVYEGDIVKYVRYRALERRCWDHGVQDIQSSVRVHTRRTVSLAMLSSILTEQLLIRTAVSPP